VTGAQPGASNRLRVEGDDLTTLYFRRAATAARKLPADVGPRALAVGMAIALDTSGFLRGNVIAGPLCRMVETDEACVRRLRAMGIPTVRGRHDLVEHFAVSAGLCVLAGPALAESAGLIKERRDADGHSGFSFVDYQANLAGIHFAQALGRSRITLADVAGEFDLERFVPTGGDLREGLSAAEFADAYGSFTDPRFMSERAKIERRVVEKLTTATQKQGAEKQ
jgi:hypothetical protein